MGIPLTPRTLEAAYDYLRTTPPFSKWKLPAGGDVKFVIGRKKDRYAHYEKIGDTHCIVFSSRYVGRHESLITTMAHELIHLHMNAACVPGQGTHGPRFQRYADKVCKIHEFDRLVF